MTLGSKTELACAVIVAVLLAVELVCCIATGRLNFAGLLLIGGLTGVMVWSAKSIIDEDLQDEQDED